MKGNNYMDAHFVSNTIGERQLWLKLIGSFPNQEYFSEKHLMRGGIWKK